VSAIAKFLVITVRTECFVSSTVSAFTLSRFRASGSVGLLKVVVDCVRVFSSNNSSSTPRVIVPRIPAINPQCSPRRLLTQRQLLAKHNIQLCSPRVQSLASRRLDFYGLGPESYIENFLASSSNLIKLIIVNIN